MATIEYDDIQLKLGSKFDKVGVERAINNLTALKELFPMSGIKETANDMKEFASAINSIKSDTIKALANLKGNLSKATKQLLDKDKLINIPAKITVAETPKDNTIKLPFEDAKPQIQVLDLAKQRAEEEKQALSEANAELQKQEDYYKSIEEIAHRAVVKYNENNHAVSEEQYDLEQEVRDSADEYYRAKRAYEESLVQSASRSNTPNLKDTVVETLKTDWLIFKDSMGLARDGVKDAFDGVADSIKNAVGNAKAFATQLAKIAKYRFLRWLISSTVSAVKEGVGNLEAWDRRVGNTGFADAMDRARESLLVLKNSLAVVGAPLLEYLVGILQKVAQGAMQGANAISRFFAILGGKTTYRAVKWADYTANAVKATTGAVKNAGKEFERQLMKFDEINNITDKKGSGGSSGYGNSGYFNYDDMFEERDVGEVSEVEKKLKAIWDWLSKIVKKTAEWFKEVKPIKTTLDEISGWYTDYVDAVTRIKLHIKEFAQGFKEARDNGAGFLEAIQAGLDNIGKTDVPKELENKFADALNNTDARFKNLDGSTAVGFAHMKENSALVSDNMKLKLGGAFNQIQNDGEKAFDGIDSTIQTKAINPVGALSGALNNVFGRTYSLTLQTNEVVNRTIHVNEVRTAIQGKGYRTNELYASGGFPTQGQMFIAREAGPELVGTIGGQTAVVNNSDIVASVSQGVAQAVASVLGGGQQVNVTLEGDAKNLFKVVQREGRAYSARTGQPALA